MFLEGTAIAVAGEEEGPVLRVFGEREQIAEPLQQGAYEDACLEWERLRTPVRDQGADCRVGLFTARKKLLAYAASLMVTSKPRDFKRRSRRRAWTCLSHSK